MDDLKNLTEPERRKLPDLAFGLDRIMLLLLFETGLEVEDLISLQVSDADLDSGSIQTASGERLKLSAQTLVEIKSYLKARPSQTYLFEGRCGKPITVKWKRCVLEKLLQRAKDRRQEAENRRQGAEERKQKIEGKGQSSKAIKDQN